jgi:hypothetical protein
MRWSSILGNVDPRRYINQARRCREAGKSLSGRNSTKNGADSEVGELLQKEAPTPIIASDAMFRVKPNALGSHRAASNIAQRRNGASQRVATVSPSRGSSQKTRTGPSAKPTPNTIKK